jgi:UDP-N-acetylmuramyl pentapeptide synthase
MAILVGPLSRATAEACIPFLGAARVIHVVDLMGGRDAEIAGRLCDGDAVLLKASRGAGLERVMAALEALPA